MRIAFLAVFTMACLAVLSGCTTLSGGKTAPDSTLLSSTPPHSIRASAAVELKRDVTLSGRAVIAAESPDKFRIEILGPFRQTVATFVSDGESLTVFSNGTTEHYTWSDPYFPYSFRAEEVVDFLTGAKRPGSEGGGTDSSWLDYRYETDTNGRVARITRFDEGFPVLTALLGDYRNVAGSLIPFNISIEDGRQTIKIRYTSVDVNPDVSAEVFSIKTPQTAR